MNTSQDSAASRTKDQDLFKSIFFKEIKISQFVDELMQKCMRCMQYNTESVLLCSDFVKQSKRVLLEVLQLEECTCEEICFFRAAYRWAKHWCETMGREVTPLTMREALGENALVLIRFPLMTIEQFQWEVVPTGLLEYSDVRPILQTLAKNFASDGISTMHRFQIEPRINLNSYKGRQLRKNSLLPGERKNSLQDYEAAEWSIDCIAAQKDIAYVPAPGDPLDKMVATYLWRLLSENFIAEAAQEELRMATTTGEKRASVLFRKPDMCMGGRKLDQTTLRAEMFWDKGASNPLELSRTLKRLCPGIYMLREDELVEIWLQYGEAMGINHGHWAALGEFFDDFSDDDEEVDVSSRVRKELGMDPEHPKQGVPLASFLSRL
jgi:hypothetical protein